MTGAVALELFPTPAPPPSRRKRGIFDHLDSERPIYAVQAAAIIAGLPDLSKVERALAQVEPRDLQTVTTLALVGIAMRIAKLTTLAERRGLLSTLPPDFQRDCEPHVKRLYQVKPWLRVRARAE